MKLMSFLLSVIIALSFLTFTGCSDEDFNLYFGVDELPQSVDPQRATLYSEILTVKNCFTGLMKLDENGNPVLGVANGYTLSDDCLTYTFTLGDSEWNSGDKVTAYDFEFGVVRACRPETKTSGADLLLNIKGAKERLLGEDADLGFYAEDDNTVVINLIKPDSNFLYKLAEPVFMPCNESFFDGTNGKYGLGTDYILTNGRFKIQSWSTKSNFIRLMRVDKGDKKVADVKSVYISMGTSGKDTVTRIKDGEVGMTINNINDFTTIDSSKYKTETVFNKNYVIVFNKNTNIGANEKLTEAFASSLDFNAFSKGLNNRFKAERFVLPENAILNGNVLNRDALTKNIKFEYSAENSRKLFLEAIKEMPSGKFPSTSVLTVEDPEIKTALTSIVSNWQSNLGAFVNLETTSNESTLLERVKSGNYKIALIPVTSNTIEALHLFTEGSAADIKSSEFDKTVAALDETFDDETSNSLLNKALSILLENSSIIPVFSTPTALIWDINYKNVYFNKNDLTVDFSLIYK